MGLYIVVHILSEHIFPLVLIEQVINLTVKTGYLKLRTDVQERVING